MFIVIVAVFVGFNKYPIEISASFSAQNQSLGKYSISMKKLKNFRSILKLFVLDAEKSSVYHKEIVY